jgi:hypothetical protein
MTRTRTADGVTLRVAAAGDLHLGEDSPRRYRRSFTDAAQQADLLVLARRPYQGWDPGAGAVGRHRRGRLGDSVLGVLGNHDCHSDQVDEVAGIFG